ncbi:hypothetical protein [Methanoculleus sp. 10]|uniref:hypothetical protein n=1 Tax=Methanoculleus sp. 10 TaxID=430615 RepID=UPI0025E12D08|nr:hypothetical protein [Methanoculleus sp. 10]
MLSYLSKKQIFIAITLAILVFLVNCGFSILFPVYLPLEDASDVVAIASVSGAIGFQLAGVWYLIARLERTFKDGFPAAPGSLGDDCPYTAVKRILCNKAYYITFIAAFLSPFIVITFVNLQSGSARYYLLSLASGSLSGLLFDVFNYGVAYANYWLLGTIAWVLWRCDCNERDEARRMRVYDVVEIYCPDRIGGLSPVRKHLMGTLYVFLISIALLVMGYINLLGSFLNFSQGQGLFHFFFSVIAEFSILSLLSFSGVALTVIGLNRLSSICLKKIEDRVNGINERYRIFQEKLFSLSPDGLETRETRLTTSNRSSKSSATNGNDCCSGIRIAADSIPGRRSRSL